MRRRGQAEDEDADENSEFLDPRRCQWGRSWKKKKKEAKSKQDMCYTIMLSLSGSQLNSWPKGSSGQLGTPGSEPARLGDPCLQCQSNGYEGEGELELEGERRRGQCNMSREAV